MRERDLDKAIREALGQDQLETVDMRTRIPRGIWVKILRAMKARMFNMPSDYISHLVHRSGKQRRKKWQRLTSGT